MSIVRVGTNPKFHAGWDRIFGKKKKAAATSKPSKKSKPSKRKAAPRAKAKAKKRRG